VTPSADDQSGAAAGGAEAPARSAQPSPESGRRAFSLRALAIGALASVVLAILTPINDSLIGTTSLYGQALPPAAVLVLMALAFVANPLLGARRLVPGELAVVLGMVLALGATVSNGWARPWVHIVMTPARHMASRTDLPVVAPRDGPVQVPRGFFVGVPEDRPIDASSAERRHLVDGFVSGLPTAQRVVHRSVVTWVGADGVQRRQLALAEGPAGTADQDAAVTDDVLRLDREPGRSLDGHRPGDVVATPAGTVTVVAVEPPGIPWYAWWPVIAQWLPLLIGFLVASLALAAIVRDQWIRHERLPYPISEFFAALIAAPQAGDRVPPLLRSAGFRLGIAVAAVVLGSQALQASGFLPVAIPTSLDLGTICRTPWTEQMYAWYMIFRPQIYLSMIAIAFFLPLGVTFSVWFFYVAVQFGWGFARAQGVPLEYSDAARAAMGGYAVECLLIVWIGRTYYGRLLATAVGAGDPALRPLVPFVWALLLGVATIAGALVAAGARADQALLAVLILLGTALVLARFVAEGGIVLVQTPWAVDSVAFSLTGCMPLAALAPLTLLAAGLFIDPRESLLHYAITADGVAERVGGVPRRRMSTAMLLVAVGGAAIAVTVLLAIAYRVPHPDQPWTSQALVEHLMPLDAAADGRPDAGAPDSARTWWCYSIGGGLIAAIGVGRVLFSWWPLHPIGALVMPSWATHSLWASFLVGWLVKLLVMRYGGVGIYRRLKPFAIGLIAGEAAVALAVLAIGLVRWAMGLPPLPLPRFLPG